MTSKPKRQPKCSLCDGTGTLVLMKSWVWSDGTRRVKCSICSGSGISSYRPSPDWVREQKLFRNRVAVSS